MTSSWFLIHTELRCTVNHTSDLRYDIVVKLCHICARIAILSDDESFRASKHFHSSSVEEIRFVEVTLCAT